MKYIIDIPSELLIKDDGYSFSDGKSYCITGNLSKLTPYTEPDRKAIEDEAWEFAWKIYSMDIGEYAEIFDDKGCPSNYQEAKAQYEAWLKQKDKIHVGDELKDDGNIRAVVLDILDADYESYEVFTENGIVDEWQKGIVVKTGRHFDEVVELLEKIRGDKE